VTAPGVDIVTPVPGGAYDFSSGTSLAAAHVSGAVALLLQGRPSLTPEEVRAILVRSARDLGAPGADSEFGAGFADALAIVGGGADDKQAAAEVALSPAAQRDASGDEAGSSTR
jgi:subtilisin family serine protease